MNYGIAHCDYVILEGILNSAKYGSMIERLMNQINVDAYAYYFKLSFHETVRRHHLKDETDFGEAAMMRWFVENDILKVNQETYLYQEMSENEIIRKILEDII